MKGPSDPSTRTRRQFISSNTSISAICSANCLQGLFSPPVLWTRLCHGQRSGVSNLTPYSRHLSAMLDQGGALHRINRPFTLVWRKIRRRRSAVWETESKSLKPSIHIVSDPQREKGSSSQAGRIPLLPCTLRAVDGEDVETAKSPFWVEVGSKRRAKTSKVADVELKETFLRVLTVRVSCQRRLRQSHILVCSLKSMPTDTG